MRRLARAGLAAVLLSVPGARGTAGADPMGVPWPQPGGPGTPVAITYSFSNLLDGTFLLLTPADLRAATEESLRLWATVAPLHFTERPDSGPAPGDDPYLAADHPQIRVGHHTITDWGHAFFPGSSGLAGDIHLASGAPWTLGSSAWNLLEVMVHEVGHALGLGHLFGELAMMNASFTGRYGGLGTAFLFEADVTAIQAIYGAGQGSVEPIPEPATLLLAAAGLTGLALRRRKRDHDHG